MKASCSLWSADLLALRSAIDALSGHADEFHLDVMDGNCVPDILFFGLDFAAAVRAVTTTPLDVHLMTRTTADRIERSAEFEIFIDGVIRRERVPLLAAAGADGVAPGSLVLRAPDPLAALAWIHSLVPLRPVLEERTP